MFEKLFVQMDADKNGAVTQEEVDTFRAAQVQSADANGDGALNIQEFESLYRAFTHTRMVDVFQVLDDNGDGVISPDETDAKFGSLVKRMDRNGDGALSIEDRGRKGGHRG
ncbi:MAG: EF-hand domain-containing protein [Alphaproteobacteria bacterium]